MFTFLDLKQRSRKQYGTTLQNIVLLFIKHQKTPLRIVKAYVIMFHVTGTCVCVCIIVLSSICCLSIVSSCCPG